MRAATPGRAPSRVEGSAHETIVGMTVRRTTFTGRAVIVVCVLAALGVTLAVPVRELLSQQSEIAALSDEVAATEERVDDLQAAVADWQDPAFVAAQARSRLHFVFPGEVGYVVLGADDRPLDPLADDEEAGSTDAWFERAWQSVTSADATPEPEAIDTTDAG